MSDTKLAPMCRTTTRSTPPPDAQERSLIFHGWIEVEAVSQSVHAGGEDLLLGHLIPGVTSLTELLRAWLRRLLHYGLRVVSALLHQGRHGWIVNDARQVHLSAHALKVGCGVIVCALNLRVSLGIQHWNVFLGVNFKDRGPVHTVLGVSRKLPDETIAAWRREGARHEGQSHDNCSALHRLGCV